MFKTLFRPFFAKFRPFIPQIKLIKLTGEHPSQNYKHEEGKNTKKLRQGHVSMKKSEIFLIFTFFFSYTYL